MLQNDYRRIFGIGALLPIPRIISQFMRGTDVALSWSASSSLITYLFKAPSMKIEQAIHGSHRGNPLHLGVGNISGERVTEALAPLACLLDAHLPYSAQEKVDYALGIIDAFASGKISQTLAIEALQIIADDEEMIKFCQTNINQALSH